MSGTRDGCGDPVLDLQQNLPKRSGYNTISLLYETDPLGASCTD